MTLRRPRHPNWPLGSRCRPSATVLTYQLPKQLAFLLCPRTEAFFGGAAGPGKTEGLLMGALQLVEQPRYSALLLRRTFRQLNQSNSIMNRARQWLANTDAVWNNADKRFTFPSGATITFGQSRFRGRCLPVRLLRISVHRLRRADQLQGAAVHLSILTTAHDQGQPAAAADAFGVQSGQPGP